MDLPDMAGNPDAHKIDHDQVEVLPENISPIQKLYKPVLGVGKHACFPYSAVDSAGDWSGGLKPTGKVQGSCEDPTKGQVYVRDGWHESHYAIMYNWYFPKEEGRRYQWKIYKWAGNRHDVQSYVVFLSTDQIKDAELVKACVSDSDSTYRCYSPVPASIYATAERLTACYVLRQNPAAHRLMPWDGFGKCDGWDPTTLVDAPAIDWNKLTAAAKVTLNSDPYHPRTSIPVNNVHFDTHLAAAWSAPLFTTDLATAGLVVQ